MAKFLDSTGLTYLWSKIQSYAKITTNDNVATIKIGGNSVTPITEHQSVVNSGPTLDWGTESTIGTVGGTALKVTMPSNPNSNTATAADNILDGSNSGTQITYAPYSSQQSKLSFDTSSSAPSRSDRLNLNGYLYATKLYSGGTEVLTSHQDISGKVNTSAIGAANGVCPLDANTKIDSQYLPSYVDDVVEAYARAGQTALSSTWLATGSASGSVITPESGKIYVLMADSGDYAANSQFRWGGSAYVKLNDGGVSAITNAEIDAITGIESSSS